MMIIVGIIVVSVVGSVIVIIHFGIPAIIIGIINFVKLFRRKKNDN